LPAPLKACSAKVGDSAFALLPGSGGRFFFASAWRLRCPMEQWKRSDFYGHGGDLDDETAFRARVAENAEHQRQRTALARRDVSSRATTPWGTSQHATIYADGVICHSTASHGGFHLDAEHNAKVHPGLRTRGGWYEEDCAWVAVAQAFPELFTDFERRCADRTIREWYPDAWEAIHERRLEPGESHEKDCRAFERDHASDWIVISAIRCDRHAGMTERRHARRRSSRPRAAPLPRPVRLQPVPEAASCLLLRVDGSAAKCLCAHRSVLP
jgi:hypothetical protein